MLLSASRLIVIGVEDQILTEYMMTTEGLRSGVNLLFRSLCTAGGVVAPAVAVVAGAQGLSPEGILLGIGAGALGIIGSLRTNFATKELEDKEKARIAETAVLLRNHDLNILVEAAFDRAMIGAAADPSLAPHTALIDSFRREVPEYFRNSDRPTPRSLRL